MKLWCHYFPREVFNPADPRIGSISVLVRVVDEHIDELLPKLNHQKAVLSIDISFLCQIVPFDDFLSILKAQPSEVIGCMVTECQVNSKVIS